MKTGDTVTASELAGIINEHGCGTIMINGSIPEPYQDVADLELDDQDRFAVTINYGMEVQFHHIGEDRIMITTGLKGRCENFEWLA